MLLTEYPTPGGQHPISAALAHTLAYAGVTNPVTGEPFSEAMLLGVSGGLGMGYILWEFEQHNRRILTMGFSNRWNYPVETFERVCSRLGLALELFETGGKITARKQLDSLLATGRPAIAWVALAQLPYMHIDHAYSGCFGQHVTIIGLDDETATLDDRGQYPIIIITDELAAARARIASHKHRLAAAGGVANRDLKTAMAEGIHGHIQHLSRSSNSFSLPAIEKWARLITDDQNAKGWRKVFADRQTLFGTLLTLFEGTRPGGANGGALRGLYADFLDEAAELLARSALKDAARRYRQAEDRWQRLGQSCLPGFVREFGRSKQIVNQRNQILALGQHTPTEMEQLATLANELEGLRGELDTAFPLNDMLTQALLQEVQALLMDLFQVETGALGVLQEAMA